jgi:hypothetical protein
MEKGRYFRVICLSATFASVLALLGCASSVPAVPMFCGLERGMTEKEFLTGAPSKCAWREFNREQVYVGSSGASVAPDSGLSAKDSGASGQYATQAPQVPLVSQSAPDRTTVSAGHDVWDVWAYEVYRFQPESYWKASVRDHSEYVILKNKRVVAWASGYPSRAVRKHPERVAMAE